MNNQETQSEQSIEATSQVPSVKHYFTSVDSKIPSHGLSESKARGVVTQGSDWNPNGCSKPKHYIRRVSPEKRMEIMMWNAEVQKTKAPKNKLIGSTKAQKKAAKKARIRALFAH